MYLKFAKSTVAEKATMCCLLLWLWLLLQVYLGRELYHQIVWNFQCFFVEVFILLPVVLEFVFLFAAKQGT
jgi:hypothetical protein